MREAKIAGEDQGKPPPKRNNYSKAIKTSGNHLKEQIFDRKSEAYESIFRDAQIVPSSDEVGQKYITDEYPYLNQVFKTNEPYVFAGEQCHYVCISTHDPVHVRPPPKELLPHFHVRPGVPLAPKIDWSSKPNAISCIEGDQQFWILVDRQGNIPNCLEHYYYKSQ